MRLLPFPRRWRSLYQELDVLCRCGLWLGYPPNPRDWGSVVNTYWLSDHNPLRELPHSMPGKSNRVYVNVSSQLFAEEIIPRLESIVLRNTQIDLVSVKKARHWFQRIGTQPTILQKNIGNMNHIFTCANEKLKEPVPQQGQDLAFSSRLGRCKRVGRKGW